MKNIATKARRHKGKPRNFIFLNLVPWCLGGYFHSSKINESKQEKVDR
jgi:hypothetical protein